MSNRFPEGCQAVFPVKLNSKFKLFFPGNRFLGAGISSQLRTNLKRKHKNGISKGFFESQDISNFCLKAIWSFATQDVSSER